MFELVECSFNVPWHGDVDPFVLVVPFESETKEVGAGFVNGNDVQIAQGTDEMIKRFGVCVFDSKVIDDKGKDDAVGFVFPQGGCLTNGGIVVFGKVFDEAIIGDSASLFQAGHSFPDLHVNPSVGFEWSKVVLLDDFIWDE